VWQPRQQKPSIGEGSESFIGRPRHHHTAQGCRCGCWPARLLALLNAGSQSWAAAASSLTPFPERRDGRIISYALAVTTTSGRWSGSHQDSAFSPRCRQLWIRTQTSDHTRFTGRDNSSSYDGADMKTDQDVAAMRDATTDPRRWECGTYNTYIWYSLSLPRQLSKCFTAVPAVVLARDRDPVTFNRTRAQLRSRQVWSHRLLL
jgi:hypothetical protein